MPNIDINALCFALLIALFVCSCSPLRASPGRREQIVRAQIHFLAESTLWRTTAGQNEDSYLADLSSRAKSGECLIRLVDTYPAFAPPLSGDLLKSERGATLRVRRDPDCDIRYGHLLLRAAPGDLIGILPVKLIYSPKLDSDPGPSAIIPCYRTVRR